MLTDSNSLGSNACQSTNERIHAYLVSTAKISYLLSDQHLFHTVWQWICDNKLTETKVDNDFRWMVIFSEFYRIVCGQKRECCVWEVGKGNSGRVPLCGRERRTKKEIHVAKNSNTRHNRKERTTRNTRNTRNTQHTQNTQNTLKKRRVSPPSHAVPH